MKLYCLIILFLAQLSHLPAKGFFPTGIKAIDISCRTTSLPNKIIVHIDLLRDYIGPAAPNYLSLTALDTMQGIYQSLPFLLPLFTCYDALQVLVVHHTNSVNNLF